MRLVELVQGSPEWLAHRAKHFNASDAPAMLGLSPHKSRRQLLAELSTGITPEVDPGTQRRFNLGHRAEALARPLAEEILGEPLYPATGVEGIYSASFDGITLDGKTIFEHKALNEELRQAFRQNFANGPLPERYRVQVEHQFMVSGAEQCLFMASSFDAEGKLVEEHHAWLLPDPAMRERLLAGWQQLDADLRTFEPAEAAAPPPVGVSPETLPALRIEVEGTVIASNLQAFRETAVTAIRSVRRELATDQDFADAELSVKWCREVEARIEAAKAHALSQTASIEELFRALDDVSSEARRVRLDLEKLVKQRKEELRQGIVVAAQRALAKHLAALSAEVEPFAVPAPAVDFAGALKGKRSLTAMHDAVDQALADARLQAEASARIVRGNAAFLASEAGGRGSLFPDAGRLVSMEPEAFREIVQARVAKHDAEQAERARKAAEAAAAPPPPPPAPPKPEAAAPPAEEPEEQPPAEGEPAELSLGAINRRLGFTLSEAFLTDRLGIKPAGRRGAAVLFSESQFRRICSGLAAHVRAVGARAAELVPQAAGGER